MRSEHGRRVAIATVLAAASMWTWASPARGQVIIRGGTVILQGEIHGSQAREDANSPPQPDCPSVRYGQVRMFHGSDVRSLAFTPDGKQVLAAGLRSGDVSVWDIDTGLLGRSIKAMPGGIMTMNLSGHGKMLAAACSNRLVRLVSTADGTELMHARTKSIRGTWAKISPDGKWLGYCDSGSFYVLELATGKRQVTVRNASFGAFSPDSKTIAITSIRNLNFGAQIWDLAGNKKVRELDSPPAKTRMYQPAFSPDGRYVAAGCLPSTSAAIIWDARTGKIVRKLGGGSRYVPQLSFIGDGSQLVTCDNSNALKVWNARTGKLVRTLETSESRIDSLAVSADGGLFAAAGSTGQIHVWRTDGFEELLSKVGHTGAVRSLASSRDGSLVVTGGTDGRLILWRGKSGKLLRRVRVGQTPITHVALSPDGSRAATCGNGDEVSLWNTATGEMVRSVRTAVGAAVWAAFRSGGRKLLVVGVTGATASVDVASGKVKAISKGDTKPAYRMVVSCDGSVAARYERTLVAPWSLETGRQLGTYAMGRSAYLYGLAIGPAGRLMAGDTGRSQGLVLTELDSGKVVRRIPCPGRRTTMSQMAFSPDGQVLAVTEYDGSVSMWSARSGKKLGVLNGHRGQTSSIRFSRDGKALLSGGTDGTAVRWDIRPLLSLQAPTTRPASSGDLVRSWEQLGSDDAAVANDAYHHLVSAGDEAVSVLAERLKPVKDPDADEIGRLIGDLGDRRYAVRQRASDALAKLGPLAEPALRRVFESSDVEEVRLRARQILASMDDPQQRSGATLQQLRGALVLEGIATPKAVAVLKELAAGSAEAGLTRRAVEALARLDES